MSRRDLEERFDDHVADSLSLYPYLQAASTRESIKYVDIGSGGGFPAIPLLTAGCAVECLLVERSAKKCEFLTQLARELKLTDVRVENASYPRVEASAKATVYTARATENPSRIDRAIVERLRDGDVYLATRSIASGATRMRVWCVEDRFGREGLRRSKLCLVGQPALLDEFHVEPRLRPILG
jgi:16S rRNA G527 N7-methylase RsmG